MCLLNCLCDGEANSFGGLLKELDHFWITFLLCNYWNSRMSEFSICLQTSAGGVLLPSASVKYDRFLQGEVIVRYNLGIYLRPGLPWIFPMCRSMKNNQNTRKD